MPKQKKNDVPTSNAATVGYEAQPWQYGAPLAGNAIFARARQFVLQWAGTEILAGRVVYRFGAT